MITVSESDLLARMRDENPWWGEPGGQPDFTGLRPRLYLTSLHGLIDRKQVRRAVILLGPRRVGKTVLMHQVIKRLLDGGVAGNRILFINLQAPVYYGRSLDQLLQLFRGRFDHPRDAKLFIFFDEVQYFKNWEVHLKTLVEDCPSIRFVASGSSASALKQGTRESGAGRFTEFLLPPLTFVEFLELQGLRERLVDRDPSHNAERFAARDLTGLNSAFIDYLNFGGYPEAVFNPAIRANPIRYIGGDIIEAVLMRDLPSLYGIQDTPELNRLFSVLAYNTGQEISLEALTQESGVSKTTVGKYLEYLEAAFLIQRIHRIDLSARRFQRANFFKVYLTNPSLRTALFGPADPGNSALIGKLAETAYFAQWFHDPQIARNLHYARWKGGEVDLVSLDPGSQKPLFAVEIKWSDASGEDPDASRHLMHFWKEHPALNEAVITTRTRTGSWPVPGTKRQVHYLPLSLHLFQAGHDRIAQHNLRMNGGLVG
ncbi:MAG: ATP-binding protein [Deltaproteobacteria bacterium]|nr:ATP-binding protein [Deltaproteobacteria bacterium]